jgi:ribosomal protein S18 acetylase RimI-like enzyme
LDYPGVAKMLAQAKYRIHPPQQGDLRSVMRLAWRTTNRLYPYVFFEEVARQQPEYFRIVSEPETDKVVGFVIAARQPGTDENFLLLTVEPALVGRGLRRALLRDVQKQLAEEGERRFSVEVPATDQSTLEFYRREGFDLVGIESSSDGNDRLLLSKSLPPSGVVA